VFRDELLRERVAASRVRRGPTRLRASPDETFRRHEAVLQPLLDFLNLRGRAPSPEELPEAAAIAAELGSLKRAIAVVRRAVGVSAWESVEILRSEDLLVYLALARFKRRPRFGVLPRDLQLDVRAFFRSYERACVLADEILFAAGDSALINRACASSPVGKVTRAALYLHTSALEQAPPLLRVYEGCARAYIGHVDGSNIVKLHRDAPAVSYLAYPNFETDAHPALARSILVPLRTLRVETRHYDYSENPPILHRKECFVAADHPLRARFARLTSLEERAGLFARPESIGTRRGWDEVLASHGCRVSGHRLSRTA
jgi:DNA phosphorothioation-associated putative methyltransferase